MGKLASIFVALVLVSCGGSTSDDAKSSGGASGSGATGGGGKPSGGAGGSGATGSGGVTTGGSGGTPSGGTAGTGGIAGAAATGGIAGGGVGGATGGAGGTSGAAGGGGVGGGSGGIGGGTGGVSGGPGVGCGAATCTAPEACVVCDPTNPQSQKICAQGFGNVCGAWGNVPPLRLFCDGPEDCTTPEQCVVIEGSVGTYGQCQKPSDCALNCTCGQWSNVLCRTLADCPACATKCEPYQQSPTGPKYPVNVCKS